jgi:hypothetical protein
MNRVFIKMINFLLIFYFSIFYQKGLKAIYSKMFLYNMGIGELGKRNHHLLFLVQQRDILPY